jgi:hypothetical protein
MPFAARFRQGMKAAIPIWIAFVPSSLAWGIAAQAHGLTLEEIVLMSAWVYSGWRICRLCCFAEGKSAATVLIAGLPMNLRFCRYTALALFFRGVKRLPLVPASHVSAPAVSSCRICNFRRSGKPAVRLAAGLRNRVFLPHWCHGIHRLGDWHRCRVWWR